MSWVLILRIQICGSAMSPPTWATEAWPIFQDLRKSCQGEGTCQWGLLGGNFPECRRGVGECFKAGRGECHWMGADDAGRDVLTRGVYGGRVSLRIGYFCSSCLDDTGCGSGANQWLLCRHIYR